MWTLRETVAFQRGTTVDGKPLDPNEREALARQRILPRDASINSSESPTQSSPQKRKRPRRKPIRTFVKSQIYQTLYALILSIFGLYVRLRQAYHAVVDRIFAVLFYHHRTPEWIRKDIQKLGKMPQHLSVILSMGDEGLAHSGLDSLLNDLGDIAAWCASAGIPMLSVYERTGVLKRCVPQAYQRIRATLYSYFGDTPYAPCPTISVRAANEPSYSPPTTPSTADGEVDPRRNHLNVLLLSEDDGRNNLVDLTKTLATMAQQQKLSPDDITADVVEAEISESVMGEPDLLILFGPRLVLEGYPPWQVRLTEIL